MTARSDTWEAYAALSPLTLHKKLEHVAVLMLSGLIAVVVVAALWTLTLRVVRSLVLEGSFDPANYETFQSVFGAMFTVIIALEFKRSILVAVERHDTVFEVRIVVLLALLAILRKFILLDTAQTESTTILALSAAVVALGGAYWVLRDQDARFAAAQARHEEAVHAEAD